jgi:hypothetical protein
MRITKINPCTVGRWRIMFNVRKNKRAALMVLAESYRPYN